MRKRRTLAAEAVAEIQRRILDGDLKPGDRLHIEELAETLDMSPMPIREALQRLDDLGFAEYSPHRGSRVRSLSMDEMVDLYSTRLPLEILAVRRAARRFSSSDKARATEALRAYESSYRSGDSTAARRAHLEFHLSIYEATQSQWLVKLVRMMYESGERFRLASLTARGTIASRIREHQAILDACCQHDPEAATDEVTKHLLRTVEAVSETIETREEIHDDVHALERRLGFLANSIGGEITTK